MVYDARAGYTLLYGGEGATDGSYLGLVSTETWAYSNGIWRNLSTSGPSPPSYGGSMAYDPVDGYMVLYGGGYPCPACNVTWIFSGGEWLELNVSAPPPRFYASLAWDPLLGELILFGGYGCHGGNPQEGFDCSDTWSFVHGKWTELDVSGPPPRNAASMTYVPAAGGLILFGGEDDAGTALQDTWLFNGQWTNLSVSGPPARIDAQLAAEPSAGDAILFGGLGFTTWPNPPITVLGDTWLFSGTAWQELATSGPSARYGGMMAYDATDGYDLLYGGDECPGNGCWSFNDTEGPSSLNDTWTFSLGNVTPTVTTSIAPTAVCVVGDRSCSAQAWEADVNLTVRAAYSNSPLSVATLAEPALTVLPWGKVQIDLTSPIVASCLTQVSSSSACGSNVSFLAIGGTAGLQLRWNATGTEDTLYVGDVWTLNFSISVDGPPYGSVPIYACTTGTCLSSGSGTIEGSFSSVASVPLAGGSPDSFSLPYANVTVDPPHVPSGGTSGPISTLPPPAPTPSPVGLPGPVTLPNPVLVPSPILASLGVAVPSLSLSAAAAGILSAGFARVVLQRRSIAVGQPVGNPVRGKRSAFDDARSSDGSIERLD
jgi:hypothetical protein